MPEPSHRTYSFGDFTLDPDRGRLLRDGQEIKLRPKSFEVLMRLVERHGQLLGKAELMQAVWPDTFVTDDSLVQCLIDVRRALGDEGQRYVKTVSRRGYIFDAEVVERGTPGAETIYAEQVEGVRVVIEEVEERREGGFERLGETDYLPAASRLLWHRLRQSGIFWAASLTIIALAAALSYRWLSGQRLSGQRLSGKLGPAAAVRPRSIAVLPFKPLVANERDEALELGMADTLITRLSGLRQLIVRPTSAVRNYTALDQDPLAAGRQQRVDAVLEGSFHQAGEKIRVTVRLLNVRDGAALWAYQRDEYYTDIFAAQDAISQRVTEALAMELSGEERKLLSKHYTDNPDVYRLYAKGAYFRLKMTEEGLRRGIEYFNQAIEKDPNYALAYTGLANAYGPLMYFGYLPVHEGEPKMKAAAMKAIELDDSLDEAHIALGVYKLHYEWDWAGAEQALKRSLEFNPNHWEAHHFYANYLSVMGRLDEALAARRRSVELDPTSFRANWTLGRNLVLKRQYYEAAEQYRNTIELDPGFAPAHLDLGWALEWAGRNDEAIAAYLKAASLSGALNEEITALRNAYRASGMRGYRQKLIENLLRRSRRQSIQGRWRVSPWEIANHYARLGEKGQALTWLEKAIEERDPPVIHLKNSPDLDSLRSDPEYAGLLRRMRLAP